MTKLSFCLHNISFVSQYSPYIGGYFRRFNFFFLISFQVRRIQGLVDKLDNLKAKNANLSIDIPKADSIEPSTSSSKVTQESEVFE